MKSILQITKSAGNQLIRIANEHKCPYILFYVNGGGYLFYMKSISKIFFTNGYQKKNSYEKSFLLIHFS